MQKEKKKKKHLWESRQHRGKEQHLQEQPYDTARFPDFPPTNTDCTHLSLIFTTKKKFYSKRDSTKTNIINLESIIKGTIQTEHYFCIRKNTYYDLSLTPPPSQKYFYFIVYVILDYVCRTAGNRFTERLYLRSDSSVRPI